MATDARLLSLWLPFCRHLQSTIRPDQPVLARGEPVSPEEPALSTLYAKRAAGGSSSGTDGSMLEMSALGKRRAAR
jgi:hypothetical protein